MYGSQVSNLFHVNDRRIIHSAQIVLRSVPSSVLTSCDAYTCFRYVEDFNKHNTLVSIPETTFSKILNLVLYVYLVYILV